MSIPLALSGFHFQQLVLFFFSSPAWMNWKHKLTKGRFLFFPFFFKLWWCGGKNATAVMPLGSREPNTQLMAILAATLNCKGNWFSGSTRTGERICPTRKKKKDLHFPSFSKLSLTNMNPNSRQVYTCISSADELCRSQTAIFFEELRGESVGRRRGGGHSWGRSRQGTGERVRVGYAFP